MLHEIGVQLAAALGARGLGLVVVDGPERRTTTTFARERVVIEHDTAPDAFGSKMRADKSPQTRMTRVMACKITIYAKAPSAGAAEWEHRRRAETILDCVLISMDVIAKGRQNNWLPRAGRFVYPEDLKDSETPGGAIYELTFTFDRGVANKTWPTTTQGTGVPANPDGTVEQRVSMTNDNTGVTFASETVVSEGSTSEDVN